MDRDIVQGAKNRRRGFTAIEMLIVVVLISLTVAWGLPQFSIARYRADAGGRLVRSLLQDAQRNAITRQSDVIVCFDSAGRRLLIVQDLNNNGAIDAGELTQYRRMSEGAQFVQPNWTGVNGTTPTGGVVGSTLSTVSSMPAVIFRRDGSASSNLEIYVTTRDAVRVEYRAITLTASTGRTSMSKWNGKVWQSMTQ
jgi:prepilin-type N-terminal cleavage/methylation domain-containing protein